MSCRCLSIVPLAVAMLLTAMILATGCGPERSAAAGTDDARLIITGSSTLAPLVAEIAKRFEAVHPGVRVDVQSGGSSRGIADVRRGLAGIGMASRDLAPDEGDLTAHAIALDGIGIIVHADNPVTGLDARQVRGIFKGDVTDWGAVGGVSAPIVVVNKAEGRATLELFLTHFGLRSTDIDADVVIGDNEQGIKTVAGNPDAIGYVSIGAAAYNASAGVPVKLLAVGGVPATLASVRDGSFPIVRRLNLVTSGDPDGLARQFIDFARSDRVHDLIESLQFVPIDG